MRWEIPLVVLGLSVTGCSAFDRVTPVPSPTPISESTPMPGPTRNPARVGEISHVEQGYAVDRFMERCEYTGKDREELNYLYQPGWLVPITTNRSVEITNEGVTVEKETAPFTKIPMNTETRNGPVDVVLSTDRGLDLVVTVADLKMLPSKDYPVLWPFKLIGKCPAAPSVKTPEPTPTLAPVVIPTKPPLFLVEPKGGLDGRSR